MKTRFAPSRRVLLAAGLAAALPGAAWAAFPDKPLRLVVPFPPGGAADVIARLLAQRLGAELGQQMIIDNRGGGGGTLAAEMVAHAPADGYTLLFGTVGTQAINPALFNKLRYDPVKDFAPVSMTHINPRVLVVGAQVPARTVAEFVALAKAQPRRLTYGSAGNGSTSHLAGALFESMAGVDLVHVPYKGSAPLLTDLLAGRIDATFDSLTVYDEHIKSGRVRALGVTSRTRMPALPQVPTIAESGLPGYEMANWLGLLAPAGTPREVVTALHAATVRAMSDAAMKRQLAGLGMDSMSTSPEEFAGLIRSEIPKWAKIVKASGAQVD